MTCHAHHYFLNSLIPGQTFPQTLPFEEGEENIVVDWQKYASLANEYTGDSYLWSLLKKSDNTFQHPLLLYRLLQEYVNIFSDSVSSNSLQNLGDFLSLFSSRKKDALEIWLLLFNTTQNVGEQIVIFQILANLLDTEQLLSLTKECLATKKQNSLIEAIGCIAQKQLFPLLSDSEIVDFIDYFVLCVQKDSAFQKNFATSFDLDYVIGIIPPQKISPTAEATLRKIPDFTPFFLDAWRMNGGDLPRDKNFFSIIIHHLNHSSPEEKQYEQFFNNYFLHGGSLKKLQEQKMISHKQLAEMLVLCWNGIQTDLNYEGIQKIQEELFAPENKDLLTQLQKTIVADFLEFLPATVVKKLFLEAPNQTEIDQQICPSLKKNIQDKKINGDELMRGVFLLHALGKSDMENKEIFQMAENFRQKGYLNKKDVFCFMNKRFYQEFFLDFPDFKKEALQCWQKQDLYDLPFVDELLNLLAVTKDPAFGELVERGLIDQSNLSVAPLLFRSPKVVKILATKVKFETLEKLFLQTNKFLTTSEEETKIVAGEIIQEFLETPFAKINWDWTSLVVKIASKKDYFKIFQKIDQEEAPIADYFYSFLANLRWRLPQQQKRAS